MLSISFYNPGIILSSQIPDIPVRTSDSYADVAFLINGLEIFSSRYYPLDGSFTLAALAPLVHQYFAERPGEQLAECTIEASTPSDDAELNFNVLCCTMKTPMSFFALPDWLRQNFLTAAPFRRVGPDAKLSVSWYSAVGDSLQFMVYATYLDQDGNRAVYQYAYSGNGFVERQTDIRSEYVPLSAVVDRIKERTGAESVTLLSVTLRLRERSLTYFIDPSLAEARRFYFLNCFNIVEEVAVLCDTAAKTSAERSLASIGGGSLFYDVSVAKEYESQTSALSTDDCILIEQMLVSPDVRVLVDDGENDDDFGAMAKILITDFTCEISDKDDEPNAVKFTWRYVDNTPQLLLPQSQGIFNEIYNAVFS